MKKYTLSYILTTFNKLSYLKVTLPYLIEACKDDEEIVIVDGGSTDGTREYLEELHQQNRIHQLLSESDYGESHGTNKAMLTARGDLIKLITDDDVYSFKVIQECKTFMLENPDIDVLGFDGYGYLISTDNPVFVQQYVIQDYKKWQQSRTPFIFCGLSLLFRKKSLALLGLFNTTIMMIDFEYTIRITSCKSKIAWYAGLGYVNIANEKSNSIKHWKLSMIEKEKLTYFYLNKLPFILFKNKDSFKNIFRPFKRMIFGKVTSINQIDFPVAFRNAQERLDMSFNGGQFLK